MVDEVWELYQNFLLNLSTTNDFQTLNFNSISSILLDSLGGHEVLAMCSHPHMVVVVLCSSHKPIQASITHLSSSPNIQMHTC